MVGLSKTGFRHLSVNQILQIWTISLQTLNIFPLGYNSPYDPTIVVSHNGYHFETTMKWTYECSVLKLMHLHSEKMITFLGSWKDLGKSCCFFLACKISVCVNFLVLNYMSERQGCLCGHPKRHDNLTLEKE